MSFLFATQPRKRPVTYGKVSQKTGYSAPFISSLPEQLPDQKSRAQSKKLPQAKQPASAVDEFQVPLSDDDETEVENVAKLREKAVTVAKPIDEFDIPLSEDDIQPVKPRTQALTKKAGKRKATTPPKPTTKATGEEEHERSGLGRPSSPQSLGKRKRDPVTHVRAAKNVLERVSPPPDKARPAPVHRAHPRTNLIVQGENQAVKGMAETFDEAKGQSSPRLPRTPARRPSPSQTTPSARGTTTPKQSDLWDQLLAPDPAPTAAPSEHLAERPRRTVQRVPTIAQTSAPSHSHVRTRTRLVDQLKTKTEHSASSEDESMDDQDSGDTLDVQQMPHNRPAKIADRVTGLTSASSSQVSIHVPSQAAGSVALGPKVTYARSRSYLQEDDLEADLLLAMPLDTPRRVISRNRVVNDHEGDSDEGMSQGIRSIHELRAAGSKKRFTDDIEHLLEEIKDHKKPSQSRRRSALMELATKLADKSFVRRFLEHGYDQALAAELRHFGSADNVDLVADVVLLVALLHVLETNVSKHTLGLFHTSDILALVPTKWTDTTTMARLVRDRKSNMSKVGQSTLMDFAESFRISAVWDGHSPLELTTGVVALKATESLVLGLRERGIKNSLIGSAEACKHLLALMTESEPTNPSADMALSILEAESTSITPASGLSQALWMDGALVKLADALPSMMGNQQRVPRGELLCLRLLLNLTNNNAKNCDVFAKDTTILCLFRSISYRFSLVDVDTDALDALLLSLGMMINLAEFSNPVRVCAVTCDANMLRSLVALFAQGQEKARQADSMEQSQGNVAYGYLAILLGNLCLDDYTKHEIRAGLPGQNLSLLVQAVQEFVHYHQKVDSLACEGEDSADGGEDNWQTFTGRLLAVLERIQE